MQRLDTQGSMDGSFTRGIFKGQLEFWIPTWLIPPCKSTADTRLLYHRFWHCLPIGRGDLGFSLVKQSERTDQPQVT